MSSSKFVEWGNNFNRSVVGLVSGAIVCIEPHEQHIHQDGPVRPAFYVPVVAGTSSSISTYLGTGITPFGR